VVRGPAEVGRWDRLQRRGGFLALLTWIVAIDEVQSSVETSIFTARAWRLEVDESDVSAFPLGGVEDTEIIRPKGRRRVIGAPSGRFGSG